MYAVIAIQGHQYLVKKGDEIVVDSLDSKEGDSVSFDSVLLTFDEEGKAVSVGAPYVEKATVKAKVVEHKKDPKIRVFKFQGKKRYSRTKGFRAQKTILSIESVTS